MPFQKPLHGLKGMEEGELKNKCCRTQFLLLESLQSDMPWGASSPSEIAKNSRKNHANKTSCQRCLLLSFFSRYV